MLVCSSQGQLYVVGGSNGHSDDLSCGEMYEPEIDDWTPVPELRTNRCNAGEASAAPGPRGGNSAASYSLPMLSCIKQECVP